MWNKLLELLGKWAVSFWFLVLFLIFADVLEIIPYFLWIVTSMVSTFFYAFCHIGVSAEAIQTADFIVSSLIYTLIVMYIYSLLK